MSVIHNFVSPKPPSADPTIVGSVEWNDAHAVDIVDADVNAAAAIAESKLALNFPTHAAVTVGVPANGLSVLGQVVSLGLASSGVTGALSGTDWDTFNNKQAALTFPLSPTLGGTGVNNGTNALTVPATGTAALLATANVFTVQQMVDGTSNQIQLRVQGHSTQTANLQTWEDSAGNIVGYVSGGGRANWNLGTSADNTFIGSGAGRIGNTGTNNIGVGFAALSSLTSGGTNLCLGANSGKKITVGGGNVCLGNQTGAEITTASSNVFIGSGSGALATGGGNTGVGAGTFTSLLGGVGNFALGLNSAYYLTDGDYNVFIGARSGARHTTEDKRLVIDSRSAMLATVADEVANAIIYGVMADTANTQTLRINALQSIILPTTTTNAALNVLDLNAYISTASTGFANGGGVGMTWTGETATDGTSQLMASANAVWVDATNATRKAKLQMAAYDTAQRIGLEIRANGSAPDIVLLGDTWWEGEGFGLPYGSMWGNEIGWTQAAAVQNTWYEISDTDISDGQLNLVTHDGNGKLTVAKAGRYHISYSLAVEVSLPNKHVQSGISVSGTEQNDGIDHCELQAANAQAHLSSVAILDLAASATIEISIRTTDTGTPDIAVDHINVTIIQIGGT